MYVNWKIDEGGEKKKRLVVIMVGAPGSGKSTFCENVISLSARPWLRVCQVRLSLYDEMHVFPVMAFRF